MSLPRGLQHRRPQLVGLFGQLVEDPLQHRPVHTDADVLHAGQHPHQGDLHLVVEAAESLGGESLL